MKKINKKAFTFVEIMIVITIIGILGTIGLASFIGNISSSRDTLRKSNLTEIFGSMKIYKLEKGGYPIPSEYFLLTNNSKVVVWQGKIDKNVGLSTIDDIPLDPKLDIPYFYSITSNKQEFQIALTLENEQEDSEDPLALVDGTYKSVAKNILPSIIIAGIATPSSTVEINMSDPEGAENRKLFILDNQIHNLPYNFDGTNLPYFDGIEFDTLLAEATGSGTFFQNSSFETCQDISDAGKSIGDGEYQLRTNTGALSGTGCTGM